MKIQGAAPRSDAAGVKKSASQVAQLSPCGLPWQPTMSVRAGTFPVEIIADMDDQVRVPGGNRLGNLSERPSLGIIAGLVFLFPVIDAAAGVADDRDAADRTRWKRQILVQDRCRLVPNGTVASHATTGKASEAGARRVMSTSKPSMTSAGHSPSTITRAMSLPSGPNSSHAGGKDAADRRLRGRDWRAKLAGGGGKTGQEQQEKGSG